MKKHLFLVLSLLTGAASCIAQISTPVDNSYIFTDKNGTEITDGSVVNVTEAELVDDGFFIKPQMNSGLYVKTNTTNKYLGASVEVNIKQISNGQVQICFPNVCRSGLNSVGITETDAAVPQLWTSDALESEWFPEGENTYGTCTVDYKLKVYDAYEMGGGVYEYEFRANGPTVTVNYIYSDPTGIDATTASKELKSVLYYDLSGRNVSKPVSGVYVKKYVYGDGTTNVEKVMIK